MTRRSYPPERLRRMKEAVETHPLIAQIALLYYKFAVGDQDYMLADHVLDQLGKIDYRRFYEEALESEHGFSKKELDRELSKMFKRMDKAGYLNRWEYLEEVEDPFPFSLEAAGEIEDLDENLGWLSHELEVAKKSSNWSRKLKAIDAVMHNYHAGIAPLEIVGLSREELVRLAEFLKDADVDQLGFIVRGAEGEPEKDKSPESPTYVPGQIEGYMPSGRPIRFGDRRPVRVHAYRRRR